MKILWETCEECGAMQEHMGRGVACEECGASMPATDAYEVLGLGYQLVRTRVLASSADEAKDKAAELEPRDWTEDGTLDSVDIRDARKAGES